VVGSSGNPDPREFVDPHRQKFKSCRRRPRRHPLYHITAATVAGGTDSEEAGVCLCLKDELVPVLERFGQLYELRLMLDFNGANRGYCFATYTTRGDAKRAARELNDLELRTRRFIGACLSVDNCRLFVGGIPRSKHRQVGTSWQYRPTCVSAVYAVSGIYH